MTNCRVKFIDDGSEMDVTIKSTHAIEEDDEEIFFYGMSARQCYNAMSNKTVCENEWQIVDIY